MYLLGTIYLPAGVIHRVATHVFERKSDALGVRCNWSALSADVLGRGTHAHAPDRR